MYIYDTNSYSPILEKEDPHRRSFKGKIFSFLLACL